MSNSENTFFRLLTEKRVLACEVIFCQFGVKRNDKPHHRILIPPRIGAAWELDQYNLWKNWHCSDRNDIGLGYR